MNVVALFSWKRVGRICSGGHRRVQGASAHFVFSPAILSASPNYDGVKACVSTRWTSDGSAEVTREYKLRLPSCHQPVGPGRHGNAIHKRFAQHNEVKEKIPYTLEHLNDLPMYDTNNLMQMYVKSGSMMDARLVFDNLRSRNVVSWNIMITGYANQDEGAEALNMFARMREQGIQPSDRTFVGALKACSSLAALQERKQVGKGSERTECLETGKVIHSEAVKGGFETDVFVGTTLVDMFAKCGSLEDAQHVFEELPHRSMVSWNAIIHGYAQQEEGLRALEWYTRMQEEGVEPNDRTFVGALRACSSLSAVEEGKKTHAKVLKIECQEKGRVIHSQVVRKGFESDIYVATTLVDMYAKCGILEDALCVFNDLPQRDVVSWNAMILGYANQEEGALALDLCAWMSDEGVHPNDGTFVGALKACSSLAALEEGKQVDEKFACLEKGRGIHSRVVRGGLELDLFVATTLVDFYAKCGSLEDARRVFDELPYHSLVSWNAMILGYAKQEEGALALDAYSQMWVEGFKPDERTFVGALKACSCLSALEEGMQADEKTRCLEKGRAIHSELLKSNFGSDVFVGNTLVDMYAKCGSLEDARRVFNELPYRDVVSWNAMILGYAQQEEGACALEIYAWMHQEYFQPCQRTFVGALKACSCLAALEERKQVDSKIERTGCPKKGRAIHFQLVRSGFESNAFVGNTLLDMYAKCGSLEDARNVFDELPYRDVVSWNAMIQGYAKEEESEEAFSLFAQMQRQSLSPNRFTFVAILKACANTPALETAKELHSQISRVGFVSAAIVANSLIDLYAKCGSMVDAQELFDSLPSRDIVPWNALLAGYAYQGESELLFHLFDRMNQEGIQPDDVTFLSVLTVCSHVGLVDTGQKYFQIMYQQHGIIPNIEHYTCMVDLFGRAGQLDEAVAMVENMPFQPNVVVWLAILGSCRNWKNIEVGRQAFENVATLDENASAAYILMANIYTDADMHEDCGKIVAMRKKFQTWKGLGNTVRLSLVEWRGIRDALQATIHI